MRRDAPAPRGVATWIRSGNFAGDVKRWNIRKTTELADYAGDRPLEEVFKRPPYPTIAVSGQGFPVGRVP